MISLLKSVHFSRRIITWPFLYLYLDVRNSFWKHESIPNAQTNIISLDQLSTKLTSIEMSGQNYTVSHFIQIQYLGCQVSLLSRPDWPQKGQIQEPKCTVFEANLTHFGTKPTIPVNKEKSWPLGNSGGRKFQMGNNTTAPNHTASPRLTIANQRKMRGFVRSQDSLSNDLMLSWIYALIEDTTRHSHKKKCLWLDVSSIIQ